MDHPGTLFSVKRLGAAAVIALVAACSHRPPPPQPVLAPPLVELADLGAIGMIDFTGVGPDGLAPSAGQQFLASLQSAQPGIAVLELGPREGVLAAVGGNALDPETLHAIGAKYRVDAILVGEVRTRESRPQVSMREMSSFTASAEMEGALSVRIFETERGATLWTTSAETRASLARVELSPFGVGDVDANQPDEVRIQIVEELVSRATADFQPRWFYP